VSEAFPGPVAQLAASLQHQAGAWRFQPASWLLFDRLIQAFLLSFPPGKRRQPDAVDQTDTLDSRGRNP
jgi:hypothetical protein